MTSSIRNIFNAILFGGVAATTPQEATADVSIADIGRAYNVLSFEATDFGSYTNQDEHSTTHEVVNNTELNLSGNSWKTLPVDYTVTENTYVTLDYRTKVEGELHGLVFLQDSQNPNTTSTPNVHNWTQYIRLDGTQTNGTGDNPELSSTPDADGYQTITVKLSDYNGVGTHLSHLVFANDDDVNKAGKTSFKNIAVFERETPLSFEATDFGSYTNQDEHSTTHEVVNNTELNLSGNSWKTLPVDYTVTENTYVTLDYRTKVEGELHGLVFLQDSQNPNTTSTPNVHNWTQYIRLDGTQTNGTGDNPELSSTPDADGYQTITVKLSDYNGVGTHLSHLVFANDDDVNKAGKTSFKNIAVFEKGGAPITPVNNGVTNLSFETSDFSSFKNQDKNPTTFDVIDDSELHLAGDTWKGVSFGYTVTENSFIQLEYRTITEGEIHGLYFLHDGMKPENAYYTQDKLIRLDGTQNENVGTHAPLYTADQGEWQTISVKLSDYYDLGEQLQHIVFINDDDTANIIKGESQFRNIQAFENYAPVLSDQIVYAQDGVPVEFDPLADSYDAEGDQISVLSCDGNESGTLSVNLETSMATYTANNGFEGEEFVNCYAQDELGNVSPAAYIDIIVEAGPKFSDVLEDEFPERYNEYTLSDMGAGNIHVQSDVHSVDITYSGVEKLKFADGTYKDGSFTQLRTSITFTPDISFPPNYCSIYMTYGLDLDDTLLDNDGWKDYIDSRMSGERTEYPAAREFYTREQIETFVATQTDGSLGLSNNKVYGTAENKVGVMYTAVVPDNDGLCKSFDETSNAPEERYKTEIPITGLWVHDGTRKGYSHELFSEGMGYMQDNYPEQYQNMIDAFSGQSNDNTSNADDCADQYPDDTIDTDGDQYPDYAECILGTDPNHP